MNARIFALLVSLFPALVAPAQTPHRLELDRAQRDYETATKQALDPVKRRYADTLQQLLRRATAANDLDTAVRIQEALAQLGPASLDARLVGTKWTFPVKGKPREQQWMEFQANGVLKIGWDQALKTWKPGAGDRVVIHPYSSEKFSFLLELDANLRRGRIVDGEFAGQTIERAR